MNKGDEMMGEDKEYRWCCPYCWLRDYVDCQANSGNAAGLRRILDTILETLDNDTIQDLFENEMDDDGYFDTMEDQR